MHKFQLIPNAVKVWSKAELEKKGYYNPHHDFYLVFFIDKKLIEGDFANMSFDKEKLKTLLNKYGKDNAGHDKGAVAIKFSELISCKKM